MYKVHTTELSLDKLYSSEQLLQQNLELAKSTYEAQLVQDYSVSNKSNLQ